MLGIQDSGCGGYRAQSLDCHGVGSGFDLGLRVQGSGFRV